MSGEQLERSILERKEREELKAIANAMSLDPPARSKKADLVDQILRAAGVEVDSSGNGAVSGGAVEGNGEGGSNGKTPRARSPRSRSTKTKAEEPDASDAAESPAGGEAPRAGSDAAEASSGADEAKDGKESSEGGGSRSGSASRMPQRRFSFSAAPDEVAEANGGIPAAKGIDEELAFELSDGPGEETDGADRSAVASGSGEASRRNGASPGRSRAGGGRRAASVVERGGAAGEAGDRSGEAEHAPTGEGRRGEAVHSETAASSADRASADGAVQALSGDHRAQGTGSQQQSRSFRQQGQAYQAQGNQQAETGNRRSRRRRGRERGERDLQGAGQQEAPWQGELVPVKGLVDLREEGYGFLRTTGYLAGAKDVYVSVSQARRFAMRRGDAVEGACRPAGPSEKYPALLRVDTVNGMTPDEARERVKFEDLTPLFPDQRLHLESRTEPLNVTSRIVDLISPIGRGQRSMIVSPPKAGKTTILKQIAHSIEQNDPDVHLMVLLVDERPEEATDWRRSVRGEVIASTFDRPSEEHTQVSELAIERAKRLVELGKDVVIILDGITRLARAYNLAQPATGRIMSGGVDSGALYPPKKFFGAARNIEEGGSLTILATALVETGSKMDEVIFEEFKGTGNMELRLDRKLAERRIYPAIDVNASSTRHEELLFDRSQLQQVWKLRRVLNALGAEGNAAAGLELLMDKIKTTRSNDEFLAEIAKAPSPQN